MLFFTQHGDEGVKFFSGDRVLQFQVPVAGGFLLPAETDGARGQVRFALGVHHNQFPFRVLLIGIFGQIGGPQEPPLVELLAVGVGFQDHHEGQVGITLDVVGEVGHLPVGVALLQDDVDAGLEVGPVAAGYDRYPQVGILGHVGIVGGHHYHFRATVFCLRQEVTVGSTGLVEVRTDDKPVGALIPVGALTILRLVAEHGGFHVGQVVIPLVVTTVYPAQQVVVTVSRDKTQQAHGGNGRKGGDVVGAVFLDGVDLGPGDQFRGFVPGDPLPAALAPGGLVCLGPLIVLRNGRPCFHGVFARLPLLLVGVPQDLADIGVFWSQGTVGIPGSGRPPLASSRLHVGNVGVDLRVVYLLELPAD